MCTEGMARAFRGSYPAIGACTLLVCIYIVSISPPLHAEIYSTTAIPINGTLQVIPFTMVVLKKGVRQAIRVN